MKSVWIDRFFRHSGRIPLPVSWYARLWRPPVIALCYHVVSDEELPHIRGLYDYKDSRMFRADLRYIKNHFRPVSYEEIEAGPVQKEKGKIPVLVTFDDGCRECHSVVLPILREEGVPAVFFLTTAWIGNQVLFHRHLMALCLREVEKMPSDYSRPLLAEWGASFEKRFAGVEAFRTWFLALRSTRQEVVQQIAARLGIDSAGFLQTQQPYMTSEMVQELKREGHCLGAHSHTHARLSELTAEQMAAEILTSANLVRIWSGQARVPFAFPRCGDGIERHFLLALRRQHPHLGLFFDSKDFKRDVDFIRNRVWCDQRAGSHEKTNLPQQLRTAFHKQPFYALTS